MTERPTRPGLHRDESGFVMSFLLRTIIVFVLLALTAYEAGQIILADVQVSKAASAAAQAAATTYSNTKSFQKAQDASIAAALDSNADAEVALPIKIAGNGEATVTVTLKATTAVVGKVSFLKHFGVRTTSDTQGPAH
jgi:Flp pilus assembly protein TadG